MLSRTAAFMLAAGLMATAAQAQTTIDIPIDQAGAVARQAFLAGDLRTAIQIAEAVLTQNPDDRTALLVLAAAAPQAGNAARGVETGARAWRLSESGPARYEAARLTAIAAAADNRLTTAAFWMRLALFDAPTDATRAQALAEARQIAQRNPLQVQLSFALAPSDNVNGGASSEVSTAPGNPTGTLSEDALAQEGWRASLGLNLRYRFQESPESRSLAGLSLQAGRVKLTGDTTIPDEAYDTNSVEATLRHERVIGGGLLGLSASRGQYNYRDLDLAEATTEFDKYDITRLSVDYSISVSDNMVLQLGLGRDTLDYQSEAIGEVIRTRANAGVSYALSSGDRLTFSTVFTDSDADNVNYISEELGLSAGYSFAEPFGPITLSLGAGVRWSEYPRYQLLFPVTGGRQDETYSANVNIGFPQAAVAGFIPGLRIDYSQTDSNVSRFDRNSLGASLTVRSSF